MWPPGDRGLLPTVGRGGMTVEVGPLAHSTVDAAMLLQTMKLIARSLDYIETHNKRVAAGTGLTPLPPLSSLPIFKGVARIDYPRDASGDATGFIHPKLQGRAVNI